MPLHAHTLGERHRADATQQRTRHIEQRLVRCGDDFHRDGRGTHVARRRAVAFSEKPLEKIELHPHIVHDCFGICEPPAVELRGCARAACRDSRMAAAEIHFTVAQIAGMPACVNPSRIPLLRSSCIARRAFLRQSAAAIFLAPLLRCAAAEREFAAADFISVQKGDLPIIISAPHGGTMPIPGVPERTGEGMKKGGAGFFAGRDENTELLAAAIADAIEKRLGKKPFFVIAKMHRKFVDANRPPEIAVEHPRAREVYDAYRGTVAKFCDDVQTRFGRGLVIDVHGQGSARDTVFRGTHNGTTDAMLAKMFGERIHAGPQSLAGLLVAHGINMKPTDTSPETSGFTGGHIVQTSGKHEGIGAVQLEFGMDVRAKTAIKSSAEKVADGIADFAKLDLLGKPESAK